MPPLAKDTKMNKVIRDGKVAVLVAPGYGSGWSSWNVDQTNWVVTDLLFDPVIVELIESILPATVSMHIGKGIARKIVEYAETKYPRAYLGAVYDLEVQWVPVGAKFRIAEYDGSESLVLETEDQWFIA